MSNSIDINLYAFGNAAQNTDCALGPEHLKKALLCTDFAEQLHFHKLLQTDNHLQQVHAVNDIKQLSQILAQSTQQSFFHKRFFISLGGDHTIAIGSWSGAANAIEGDLGMIWVDAHMDANTPQTTISNNRHGMPFAILLGHGETELTKIVTPHPKLKPENCVLIGIRSYESGEAALLKNLGVKIFFMDDINKLGMHAVIHEALKIATRNTTHFGVSIDLDGFDPHDAPGVGSAEKNGICAQDFLTEFTAIAKHPKLIGADIAEFNPLLDVDHKTEKLVVSLCRALANIR